MQILGVKIDNVDFTEAMKKIESLLLDKQQCYVVTPNPEFLVRAQKDKQYKKILNQADLAVPDGIGLLYAARFLRSPLKQKVAGVALMDKICQRAAQKKWQVFLHGGLPEPQLALITAKVLRKKYPGLKIDLLGKGDQQTPTVLFVALGSPKQEKWIAHYLPKLSQIDLAIGVGGSFDFLSGRIKRAPAIIQNAGLEWLWRFTRQPWRIKRIYKATIVFPWLVIKEKFKK